MQERLYRGDFCLCQSRRMGFSTWTSRADEKWIRHTGDLAIIGHLNWKRFKRGNKHTGTGFNPTPPWMFRSSWAPKVVERLRIFSFTTSCSKLASNLVNGNMQSTFSTACQWPLMPWVPYLLTYCWWFRNPAPAEVGSFPHYWQGFMQISSIIMTHDLRFDSSVWPSLFSAAKNRLPRLR